MGTKKRKRGRRGRPKKATVKYNGATAEQVLDELERAGVVSERELEIIARLAVIRAELGR